MTNSTELLSLDANSQCIALIDGSNFYNTVRQLGINVDFARFRQWLGAWRVNYYTAIVGDDTEHQPLRGLLDWLEYNGYNMVTKPAKQHTRSDGSTKTKGNMDIEIAVDALEAASWARHIMLCTGDGDFVALVRALQRRGVYVTVISSIKATPPMMSDDLRRACDAFIDIADIAEQIERKGDPENAT